MSAEFEAEVGTSSEARSEERVRKGTLIDALYRKYHGTLRKFLARHHVNPDEAADIVQETYCRVLNADRSAIRGRFSCKWRPACSSTRRNIGSHSNWRLWRLKTSAALWVLTVWTKPESNDGTRLGRLD